MSTPICTHCAKPFERRYTSMQAVCSPRCAARKVAADKRAKAEAAKAEKRADRAKLESFKRLPTLIAEAQHEVNRYVRLRDELRYGRVCISCGARPTNKPGGTLDAGHFRSRGSAPHLRFYLPQIALQCVRCNRDRGGERDGFKRGLVERLGAERVDAIEAMNFPSTVDREYLRRMKRVMAEKANRMKKRLDSAR